MSKAEWEKRIRQSTEDAGTYRPFFDSVIETLADILAKRDEAQEQYEKSGGKPIVKHTNKSGATNLEQNPALRLINDYNRDALAYWRDLGLTPAGLRKINDKALVKKQKSNLAEALKGLG